MHQYFFDYIGSYWGLITLSLTSLAFGLKAYDVFAKTWPATTGRYVTEGTITWSEFIAPEIVLLKQAISRVPNEGLISYSYRVNGAQHNGTIATHKLTQEEVDKDLFKGAQVRVFFSPRKPQYSRARKPPSKWQVAEDAVFKWLVFPVTILNGISFFIWFLAHA